MLRWKPADADTGTKVDIRPDLLRRRRAERPGVPCQLSSTSWLAGHWQALPRAESIHVDGAVLAFSIGLVFVTALLAGLVPAISSTGEGVLAALQESSRSIGGSSSRAMLRKTMLTAEIALTVVLLVSAGLLFKSFLHLRTADLGCITDRVLTVQYGLSEKQYDTREKVLAFHQSVLERVRRLPGVRAAALVSTPPGGGYEGDRIFTIPEHPLPSFSLQNDALNRTADPQYFTVMQIPLIRGRFFTDHERLMNDRFIIISRKFEEQFFAGDNPIGRHVRVNWGGKLDNYEIIGVVGDTLYDVTEPVKATMYFPILSGIPTETGSRTAIVARSNRRSRCPFYPQFNSRSRLLILHCLFTTFLPCSKYSARAPQAKASAQLCWLPLPLCLLCWQESGCTEFSRILSRSARCRDRHSHRTWRSKRRSSTPGIARWPASRFRWIEPSGLLQAEQWLVS